MQFDTVRFFQDLGIPYIDSHGMLTREYIGVEGHCPLCHHGGGGRPYGAFRRDARVYTCWNCKSNDFWSAIQIVSGITDKRKLSELLKKYSTNTGFSPYSFKKEESKPRPTKIVLPGDPEMIQPARRYLRTRGFSPEYLWQKYSLRSTTYGKPSYRIIIPVTYNGRVVSYTSRDYTNKQELRVVSCKKDLEIIPHKHLFLGLDHVRSKNVMVVEGPFDCFRVGSGGVSSFGSEITLQQTMLLAEKFDNVFLCPDGKEEKPLELMKDTARVLNSVGTNAEVIELDEALDPDDFFRKYPEELIYLKKDLNLY